MKEPRDCAALVFNLIETQRVTVTVVPTETRW
jgi:hypothetical protein